MATDLAQRIAKAYRWQRRLGNAQIVAPGCHLVADPRHPDVWDSNHADEVTARTNAEIDAVFAAMDRRLGHTSWRVIHTDCFTPDAFLARLALDDFEERPVTIQMALQGDLTDRGTSIELRQRRGSQRDTRQVASIPGPLCTKNLTRPCRGRVKTDTRRRDRVMSVLAPITGSVSTMRGQSYLRP